MRVGIWKTGHEIADTVADALVAGIPDSIFCRVGDEVSGCDVHIGYGILRGMDKVYRECERQGKPYFIVDNGYWKPGHYDGYYRISLNGTQQTTNFPAPDYERWERLGLEIKPVRDIDPTKPILACPPSEAVMKFYPDARNWFAPHGAVIRRKGDGEFDGFENYRSVSTYNSSMGWKGLLNGVSCVSSGGIMASHPYYAYRIDLFATMAALQFTLDEIREGKAWDLIKSPIKKLDSFIDEVKMFHSEGRTQDWIALHYHVSRPTVRKALQS